jgi:hypothetical protein
MTVTHFDLYFTISIELRGVKVPKKRGLSIGGEEGNVMGRDELIYRSQYFKRKNARSKNYAWPSSEYAITRK